MPTKTYLFTTENGRFIINDERSKLGYAYPRIFVECPNGNVNIDTTLGGSFNMSKEDFESWLDGTEITNANLKEICKDIGLKYEYLIKSITEMQKGE